MTAAQDFIKRLEVKVQQQLHSQRVGYLLGAGSSYLNGQGYPLSHELWDRIKTSIKDTTKREEIQHRIDAGAPGLEQALDLLDDGGATAPVHRHLVTAAIAQLFREITAPLDHHVEFLQRIAARSDPWKRIFSLNYDLLVERAADDSRTRIVDGFIGTENAYFEAAIFEERIGRIRATHRARQFEETSNPIQLMKLHGSLGWFEQESGCACRCSCRADGPHGAKRLMVPPQRRKAEETMLPPYSALWSKFRGCLAQGDAPINRLVCIGYGFADEHVNAVITPALARSDFTLLIFAKSLGDTAWKRWSAKSRVVVVTEQRCSLYEETGDGHPDLWSFERLSREV